MLDHGANQHDLMAAEIINYPINHRAALHVGALGTPKTMAISILLHIYNVVLCS